MSKFCPDIHTSCIKDQCMAYIPTMLYNIYNPEFMKNLCKDITHIDFESIIYPLTLIIDNGFCKKYGEIVGSHELYTEIVNLEKEIINEPQPIDGVSYDEFE